LSGASAEMFFERPRTGPTSTKPRGDVNALGAQFIFRVFLGGAGASLVGLRVAGRARTGSAVISGYGTSGITPNQTKRRGTNLSIIVSSTKQASSEGSLWADQEEDLTPCGLAEFKEGRNPFIVHWLSDRVKTGQLSASKSSHLFTSLKNVDISGQLQFDSGEEGLPSGKTFPDHIEKDV